MLGVIDGFTPDVADTGDVEIAYDAAGAGPPLLLLHGYPQHRWMWRHVAPVLAERFTVIVADLRGYGQSAKPRGDAAHLRYSKRTMAADQVALMRSLGFDRFAVAGHDRGARVAHRMCLDHPAAVAAAAVIDIVPTRHLFATTDKAFADAYYHWFFLSQSPPLPERLIGAAARDFLAFTLDRWSAPGFTFSADDLDRYAAAFGPEAIHASCEDYRAAASIDLDHDGADLAERIACPLLVMWGLRGAMERLYDVPATWRERASDVRLAPVDSGHFPPEEAPEATTEALLAFFTEVDTW